MRHKSIFSTSIFIVAAYLLMLAACKRSDTNSATTPALTSADDNGGYASDAAKLESTSNDVISIADMAAAGNGSTLRTTATCASVSNDTSALPHVLTINFGTANCLCADGKYRKGEIIVTYSGRYKDSGSTHTISYNGYYVNDNKVSGGKSVTNEGTNSSGQVWYSVTLNDSITLATTDSIISWGAHRTRTWLSGYGSETRADDSYSIADAPGYHTMLTRANGHQFTFSITSPLKAAYNCDFIEAGIVTISSSTFATGDRILDYSYSSGMAGGCDDQARLTIGTHTYNITLH